MSNALSIHRPGLLGRSVFDDIFDTMLDIPTLVNRTTQGYPVADIYKDENDDTVMEFALAGFSKNDLSIAIKPEKNTVTVSAANSNEDDSNSSRRIARRSFNKTYVNYDINLDLSSATAEFKNGLLRLVLPNKPEAKPVTIKIN